VTKEALLEKTCPVNARYIHQACHFICKINKTEQNRTLTFVLLEHYVHYLHTHYV